MSDTVNMIGTAEAAAILNRSARTIQRMVAAGELKPSIKAPGGAYMFNKSDVETLAERYAS